MQRRTIQSQPNGIVNDKAQPGEFAEDLGLHRNYWAHVSAVNAISGFAPDLHEMFCRERHSVKAVQKGFSLLRNVTSNELIPALE